RGRSIYRRGGSQCTLLQHGDGHEEVLSRLLVSQFTRLGRFGRASARTRPGYCFPFRFCSWVRRLAPVTCPDSSSSPQVSRLDTPAISLTPGLQPGGHCGTTSANCFNSLLQVATAVETA